MKKKKSSLPKGKVIPDNKPENDYKKTAKKAEKARRLDKKY
jgi:hypothetical protein